MDSNLLLLPAVEVSWVQRQEMPMLLMPLKRANELELIVFK
jgi:hypothetical protein